MVEKLVFSLQVFILGFSVVLAVLFALYGLTTLFNRFFVSGTRTGPVMGGKELSGDFSPQAAAAITAAIKYYRAAGSGGSK